jgi:two-component system OmpR family response regulator
MRVLLLSENLSFANQLATGLLQKRYFVRWLRDCETAQSFLQQQQTDVLVLDEQLPYHRVQPLLKIYQPLRAQIALVLINSANASVVDEKENDDDFFKDLAALRINLNIELNDIITQIVSLHKAHVVASHMPVLKFNDHEIDQAARCVRYQGRIVYLTETEFKLLACLLQTPNRCVTTEKLLQAMYTQKPAVHQAVPVFMNKLRSKLPQLLIQTIYAQGYQLNGEVIVAPVQGEAQSIDVLKKSEL